MPTLNNSIPIIIKSMPVQITSSVNCIAISGISNRTGTAAKMIFSLLFFINYTVIQWQIGIILLFNFNYFLGNNFIGCLETKNILSIRQFGYIEFSGQIILVYLFYQFAIYINNFNSIKK